MVLLYSIAWKRVVNPKTNNIVTVRVTCLDESGRTQNVEKYYREWLGVCTGSIDDVVRLLKTEFPGIEARHERMGGGEYRKILPYFEERLRTGKLEYRAKPFYRLYVTADVQDVGDFLDRRKIAYHRDADWMVRIYVDLCTRHDTDGGFFYRWYDVRPEEEWLTDSFRMLPDRLDVPDWRIAAFDLETVNVSPGEENRVPTGSDPDDRVVMISVVRWSFNSPDDADERVLYLNPCAGGASVGPVDDRYVEYSSEKKMINDFHALVQDCQVLTGYNVNNFDVPCLFSRMVFLGMGAVLAHYTSETVGDYTVATFDGKVVLDLYDYVRVFSNFDLRSLKLDEVARSKLGASFGKSPFDSVGIRAWYRGPAAITPELCRSPDCREVLRPDGVRPERFGTFVDYLRYCLVDSDLVRRLFVKETVLVFLISRANFAAVDVVRALHYGNSRFLLEVMQTYGTVLGFFVSARHMVNSTDGSRFASKFVGGTYQGALNFCTPETYYEDVAVLDFASMYPVSMLSANLCYGTCTLLSRDEYLALPSGRRDALTAVPYRVHSDRDFAVDDDDDDDYPPPLDAAAATYSYPAFDPERDDFVIVVNRNTRAFLPAVVERFLTRRRRHQRLFAETRDVMHYNAQHCIKILVNSLYGTMASKDSPLGYLVVAMSIVTLARYQLLASYHYVRRAGYTVCYADTDSLMVQGWPEDSCERINAFLHLPHVDLKFERRLQSLLVLSKKRYVYGHGGRLHLKGFRKKTDDLNQAMSEKVVSAVMALAGRVGDPADGWILWADTLKMGSYMCRDPGRYFISRKTRRLDEYRSASCASVMYLRRYPEKEGQQVEYSFSRADVAQSNVRDWIMDAEDIRYVNFEQLVVNQKRILVTLVNFGYWRMDDPHEACDMMLNVMRWRLFVHAELLHFARTGERVVLFFEKGVRYPFRVNEHVRGRRGRRRGRRPPGRPEVQAVAPPDAKKTKASSSSADGD